MVEQWTARLAVHKGLRVLLTHGMQDATLPFQCSGWTHELLKANGAKVTYVPFSGGHELGGNPNPDPDPDPNPNPNPDPDPNQVRMSSARWSPSCAPRSSSEVPVYLYGGGDGGGGADWARAGIAPW